MAEKSFILQQVGPARETRITLSGHLALIRRCCDWIVEMEEALGIEKLSRDAGAIHEKLVPYHLTEKKELCLWSGKLLDESHRHPSHLMAIHPAMDLTIAGEDEAQAVIEASLMQYMSLGQYRWGGHTYAQMIGFAACIGRAEMAYDCLLKFAEQWIGPNGLELNQEIRRTGTTVYSGKESLYTLSASGGTSAGISDMLLQGWNDVLRVFPAIPAHWRDAAFLDLLSEGAFRVSAVRKESRTVWVRVVAGADRRLRLLNCFGDNPFIVSGGKLCKEGDLLVADMKKGQEIIAHIEGETVGIEDALALVRKSDTSRIGLK